MKLDLETDELKAMLALLNQITVAAGEARSNLDALWVSPAQATSDELAGQLNEIKKLSKNIEGHSARAE